MQDEKLNKLPSGTPIIGTRQVIKAITVDKGLVVIAASNCPSYLIEKIKKMNTKISYYNGDQKSMGTALGKSFATAIVGFKE
jgi:ribosomal protein L30E